MSRDGENGFPFERLLATSFGSRLSASFACTYVEEKAQHKVHDVIIRVIMFKMDVC